MSSSSKLLTGVGWRGEKYKSIFGKRWRNWGLGLGRLWTEWTTTERVCQQLSVWQMEGGRKGGRGSGSEQPEEIKQIRRGPHPKASKAFLSLSSLPILSSLCFTSYASFGLHLLSFFFSHLLLDPLSPTHSFLFYFCLYLSHCFSVLPHLDFSYYIHMNEREKETRFFRKSNNVSIGNVVQLDTVKYTHSSSEIAPLLLSLFCVLVI